MLGQRSPLAQWWGYLAEWAGSSGRTGHGNRLTPWSPRSSATSHFEDSNYSCSHTAGQCDVLDAQAVKGRCLCVWQQQQRRSLGKSPTEPGMSVSTREMCCGGDSVPRAEASYDSRHNRHPTLLEIVRAEPSVRYKSDYLKRDSQETLRTKEQQYKMLEDIKVRRRTLRGPAETAKLPM